MIENIKRKRKCRVCRSAASVKLFMDFGSTPLANSYLSVLDTDRSEEFFPLILNICKNCGNLQLAHVVDPDIIFKKYLYSSSTSPVFRKHFEDFAKKMGKQDFVVDIGSNDGILLKPFELLGSRVLGVEPAKNIDSSVATIREFWTPELASKILEKHGQASLITATNVFAHIDDLDSVIKGVKILLKPDGVFVVEVTDVEKMFENGSFDLIYHEHVNYWSKDTIKKFFQMRGMECYEIEDIPVHGGSIRAYARLS